MRPAVRESRPVAALRTHRLKDMRPAVRESPRVEEAGPGRVVATLAAEAGSPGPLVVAEVE